MNLRFANGALGTFLLSDTAGSAKSWEQTAREKHELPDLPGRGLLRDHRASGPLAVPTMRLKYYTKKEDRSWWKPFQARTVELERKDPLAEQIAHFAAVVRGEAEPLVTARDGLQNLRVTDAIVEAARTGQIVNTN